MADPEVARAVQEWLKACAPHLDFSTCLQAVVDGLHNSFPMISGPCPKCGRTHADVGQLSKLKATHTCGVCGHKWAKNPYVFYTPFYSLQCSLSDTGGLMVGVVPSVHTAQGSGGGLGSCLAAALKLPGNCIEPIAESPNVGQNGC